MWHTSHLPQLWRTLYYVNGELNPKMSRDQVFTSTGTHQVETFPDLLDSVQGSIWEGASRECWKAINPLLNLKQTNMSLPVLLSFWFEIAATAASFANPFSRCYFCCFLVFFCSVVSNDCWLQTLSCFHQVDGKLVLDDEIHPSACWSTFGRDCKLQISFGVCLYIQY